MQLREMTDAACIDFLGENTFGHLASGGEQYPYVVPINYAYNERELFMFSMPGLKIERLRANPLCCLQLEKMEDNRAWKSVVVQGRFRELPDTPAGHEERIHAWSLLQKRPLWWEPGSFEFSLDKSHDGGNPIFFVLSIDFLSGRHALADEAQPVDDIGSSNAG
jgi:nitroimidazol reductase NimA-like FMN-containing flavoprotein (pyridoxamine 5'-phosphate oxidase superfamily)